VQGQPAPEPKTTGTEGGLTPSAPGGPGGEDALRQKTVAELKKMAEAQEVDVKREGGSGKPQKADYIRVLTGGSTAQGKEA
jgi:hypothetical protein